MKQGRFGKMLPVFSLACAFCMVAKGVTLDTTAFNRACTFTLSGYRGTSELADFPVAIRLSESIGGFYYMQCAENGADLRFADAAGNLLPHEIETWNTSGESIVWVRVPALTGAATTVRLYFNQRAGKTLPAVDFRDVWTKYVTVVHGGSGLADSSPKQVAVQNGGGVSATMTSGVIGGGVSKPTNNSRGADVANPIRNKTLTDSTKFSLSCWYRATANKNNCLASSKKTWGGTGFLLLCQGGKYMSCAVQSTHQPKNPAENLGALVANVWNYVGFSYRADGQYRTYFDGSLIYSSDSAKTLDDEGNDYWSFGGYSMTAAADNFYGDMDELRIYDGIATADWMQAECDSVAKPNFAVAGTVENISPDRTPSAVQVTLVRQTETGVSVDGKVMQFADEASSFVLDLVWGDTPALSGGTVAVGTCSTVGQVFSAAFPATEDATTYYYAFRMTPDKGAVDYSTTNAFVVARTGAKWRPRTADDTWNSESWKVGDTLYSFCRGWNVLFDGQEENPLSTVSVPDGVAPGTVTVTGARNYSFAGDGKISGKLVKSGSGTLTLPVTQFADPLEFNVTGGTLSMPGTMYFGNAPGQARLTIGGGDRPAKVLLNDKGASFGRGAGSETYITVRNHGLIRNDSAEWTRFGVIYGAMTTLEVEAGGEVDSNWVLLGSQAARCNARVAGTITVRGNFLGVGEGSDTSLTLLPGGRIRARGTQAWLNSAVWSKYTGHPTLHVKSGTLELYPVATYNTSTPILNTLLPVTYEDAITFDIPAGGSTYCRASVTNVTASGTAHFIKTGGGRLDYSGDVGGITGFVDVQAGVLAFSQPFAEDADVTISVASGAVIGCNVVGGPARLLRHLSKETSGTLMLMSNNRTETIDVSDFPNLKVYINTGDPFTGKVITADNDLVVDLQGQTCRFASVLEDLPGKPAHLTVADSVGGGRLFIQSSNPSMTGGLCVKRGATAVLYGPDADNANIVGPSGPVRLESGSALQLDVRGLAADFIRDRVTDDSDPAFIYVQKGSAASNVDVSRFPNCRVGVFGENSTVMTGTVTPCGDTYLLGGGNTSHTSTQTGLRPGVLTDVDAETPAKVVVDRPGLIDLSSADNSYSGGTVVTNGGRVFVSGGDGFGSVPESFDAHNVLFDGGVLRLGGADATLAATRGVWIGDDGMSAYLQDGKTLTVPGGMGGSGDLSVTGNGSLALVGENNAFDGHVAFGGQGVLAIGDGPHYSWSSVGGIEMSSPSAALVVKTDAESSVFSDTVTGAASFRKEGSGTLSISATPGLTGRTVVAEGTLRLTDAATLTKNSAVYNDSSISVDWAGSVRDVFADVPVYGGGTVRFAGEGDVTVDRPLAGLSAIDVAGGHSATLAVTAPGAAISLADGAETKLLTGGSLSGVSGFADFTLNGVATRIDDGELQLTPDTASTAGSAYWKRRIDVTQPWEARFTYRAVNPSADPADGFSFVLQNQSETSVGGNGGRIGVNNVTPSFGVGFNIYKGDSIGWIENGAKTGFTTSIGGIDLVSGVSAVATYDGLGTFTITFTQGTKTFTQTKSVSLSEKLGSSAAWIGFTGGTGGVSCDQRIAGFQLIQRGCGRIDMTPTADARWQINAGASYVELEGKPTIRLTDAVNYATGSVTRAERLCAGGSFVIRGKYLYGGCTSAEPADGMAIFLHDDAPTACGQVGGGVGVRGIPTAIGWKLCLYQVSNVAAVKNGRIGSSSSAVLNGVDFRNGQEVGFALAYRRGELSLTLEQGDKRTVLTQDVDLSDYFGGQSMYFAMSGATGSVNARQYVYGLSMESEAVGGYGSLTCAGSARVRVEANGKDAVGVGALALGANADVEVSGVGAAGVAYALEAHKVVFEGLPSEHVVSLVANGAAAGTLRLGEVVYDSDRADDSLTVQGSLSPLDEKIVIRIPRIRGRVRLMDLRNAAGVTIDDFRLETDECDAKLKLVGGVLYAISKAGLTILLR